MSEMGATGGDGQRGFLLYVTSTPMYKLDGDMHHSITLRDGMAPSLNYTNVPHDAPNFFPLTNIIFQALKHRMQTGVRISLHSILTEEAILIPVCWLQFRGRIGTTTGKPAVHELANLSTGPFGAESLVYHISCWLWDDGN
jgi:hypothetical protein